ncbi:MAG: hypothetical protein J0I06_07955, partial [Planctomycetes bacterium]|nr:hypothetical protein [Planctomycetota bacterium]
MLRRLLFALIGVAAAAILVADRGPSARAADPEITGNWLFTYSPRGGTEQALAIVQVEVKDGKTVASAIYSPIKGMTVSKFESDGKTVKFNTSLGFSFEGTVGKDGKIAVGNFSSDQASMRAKLSRTDKTE